MHFTDTLLERCHAIIIIEYIYIGETGIMQIVQ